MSIITTGRTGTRGCPSVRSNKPNITGMTTATTMTGTVTRTVG